MASIMQGTTPSLTIQISPDDLLLSAVTAVELYVRNDTTTTTYHMGDLTVDTDANTITKVFTVEETSAFNSQSTVIIQARLWVGDSVIGINKVVLLVSDMIGVGEDG